MGILKARTEKLCGPWNEMLLAKYFLQRFEKFPIWDKVNFTIFQWGHCVLTTAGFIVSMRTMRGEVTNFPLLQTLPTVAGEPWRRADGDICHTK